MNDLRSDDKKYVWHPFTQVQTAIEPMEITMAKDALIYTKDGKSYIDANSSWWVNVHGHGNTHIQKAINDQFEKIDHVIFADATHEKAVELAKRVAHLLPEPLQKVFFSDNGSTAVEVALKMAFQYWHNKDLGKKRILALDGAYHGDTFGAMSIGQRGYFNEPFEPFFFDVDFLDFPEESNHQVLLQRAEKLFETQEFAALIVEPLVQGSAGMRMYPSSFLDQLVHLAQKYEVLVIFDEIMTAWGRTGKYFAMNHCSVVPDIVCLSKGLTGGVLPLGLTVASEKIFNAFQSEEKRKALLHGHSFTANPLSCAAACASLDIFEQTQTWLNVERIKQSHLQFIQELSFKYNAVQFRSLGTILAIELESQSSYFSNLTDQLKLYFRDHGILLRPLGNVLFVNPPYCISEQELEHVYTTLKKCLIEFVKVE